MKLGCNLEPSFSQAFEERDTALACPGDSLALSLTNRYTSILWSDSSRNDTLWASPGDTVWVEIRDSTTGCSGAFDTLFIQNRTPISLPQPTISPDTLFCPGDTVRFTTNTPPATQLYTWSTGDTGSVAIATDPGAVIFQVRNTTTGCTNRDTFSIDTFPRPQPQIVLPEGKAFVCDTVSRRLSTRQPWVGYQWSTNDTTRPTRVGQSGTYQLQVVDSNRCTGTTSVSIANRGALSATLAATSATICPEDSFGFYLTNPRAFLRITAPAKLAPADTFFARKPGFYQLTVQDTNRCTGRTDSFRLTYFSRADPKVISQPDRFFCREDSVRLRLQSKVNLNKVQWNDRVADTARTVDTTGRFWAITLDANGCRDTTDTLTLAFLPRPRPIIQLDSATFCSGDSLRLSVSDTFATYRWSNKERDDTAFARFGGEYSVMVTSRAGCQGTSDTVNVRAFQRPTPLLESNRGARICLGDTTTLAPRQAYPIYRWSDGSRADSLTVTLPGTYRLTVTDTNGCQGADQLPIRFLPRPDVTVRPQGATRFCQGDSVALKGPASLRRYFWSNGDTTRTTYISTQTRTRLIGIGPNGCRDTSAWIQTVVDPLPTGQRLRADGSLAFCRGDSVRLIAPAGFQSYQWNTTATGDTLSVQKAGVYNVTLTNAFGCQASTDSLQVTVFDNPQPVIDTLGPTIFCAYDSLVLSTRQSYRSYAWTNRDTGALTTVRGSGNYNVLVTDSNGCSGSAARSISVSVLPVPNQSIRLGPSASAAICRGDRSVLQVDSGFQHYRWNTGSDSSQAVVTQTGRYTVEIENRFGCIQQTNSFFVFVSGPPSIQTQDPDSICLGDSVVLKLNSALDSISWNTGDTTSQIVTDTAASYFATTVDTLGCRFQSDTFALKVIPLPIPRPSLAVGRDTSFCQGGQTVLVAPRNFIAYQWNGIDSTARRAVVTRTGRYSVTAFDSNGCRGTSPEVAVEVFSLPQPQLVAADTNVICEGDTARIKTRRSYAGYTWSTGSSSSQIDVLESKQLSVLVRDSNGCLGVSAGLQVTVQDTAEPQLRILGDTIFCQGDSVRLAVQGDLGAYQWSVGGTDSVVTLRDSAHPFLRIRGANGCPARTRRVRIIARPLPDPRIQTPNRWPFAPEIPRRWSIPVRALPPIDGPTAAATLWFTCVNPRKLALPLPIPTDVKANPGRSSPPDTNSLPPQCWAPKRPSVTMIPCDCGLNRIQQSPKFYGITANPLRPSSPTPRGHTPPNCSIPMAVAAPATPFV